MKLKNGNTISFLGYCIVMPWVVLFDGLYDFSEWCEETYDLIVGNTSNAERKEE